MLTFFMGGELYGIDVTIVERVVRGVSLSPVPVAGREVAGIVNVKGRVVVVLDLTGETVKNRSEKTARVNCVILKPSSDESGRTGFIIDKALGLASIGEDKIKPPPVTEDAFLNKYIRGVAAVGDDFYRIIDAAALRE